MTGYVGFKLLLGACMVIPTLGAALIVWLDRDPWGPA